MRGDINSVEVYQDRELLTRLGYGIYDISVGSSGQVGFEDVLRFSYLKDEEEDNKLYRRRVFELTGQYYTNELARALWDEFQRFQQAYQAETGQAVSLEEASRLWLERHGHEFFKSWTLRQQEVPFRMRNREEPRRDWLEVVVGRVVPRWRELLEAGFNLESILAAELLELRREVYPGSRYLRVVARLSGLPVQDKAELYKRLREVRVLEKYLSQQAGYSVGKRAATIEYYRRLNLVAEIESKQPAANMSLATV